MSSKETEAPAKRGHLKLWPPSGDAEPCPVQQLLHQLSNV